MTEALSVFAAALATALATGLGALPLAFLAHRAHGWLGASNAAAAGCMVAASGLLFYEGGREDVVQTLVGALAGIAFIALAARVLAARPHVHFEALASADARKALLIVGVMTLHSTAEGVGVGVSFGGGESLGLATAIAIAMHNIPEGLAISLVLVPRGVTVSRAAGWSVFSSLPQPLLALPAFASVAAFAGLLPAGLGFAGGAMVWMVAAEVVPDALRGASVRTVLVSGAAATAALVVLQALLLSA
ncbi:MAG: ZIP family metal transporter [Thermoleophilia bacterium]|nr:ZIP family metal transporter [Thermoleophilia bacterium]